MKRIILMLLVLLVSLGASAQKAGKNPLMNWYNKDLSKDKTFGVSTEKAYKELLAGKTAKPVIVAIIDGGTDITHEDLKNVIWVNTDEIPGNGIDDDKNGYIDDVNGWNFIGNPDGRNVQQDNLEATRIVRKYKDVYANGGPDGDPIYEMYKKAKAKFDEEGGENPQLATFLALEKKFRGADSLIRIFLKKDTYTLKELNKIKTDDTKLSIALSTAKYWLEQGVAYSDIKGYADYLGNSSKYSYNLDFDPRSIVGDNWEENTNRFYGNNDVAGPDPGHGTFVAGCVGAQRGNKIGVDGIAGNVQLMIVRVVPDGDERDKDVANGIRYAIENGATVINMSFGKSFSPQKQFVDEVLPLAEKYDVLLLHAAGNDGENNDVVTNYPENRDANGNKITKNWITVGASSKDAGPALAAAFSNYGKLNVDLFAPGVDVWGLEPGNKYGSASGTSMASPIAAGVAAVIRSYYPQLTAAEVKEAMMKSVALYDGEVYKPADGDQKVMSKFVELSVSGGVVNLYNALKVAEEMAKLKK
jgi:subtilisin family serine protease